MTNLRTLIALFFSIILMGCEDILDTESSPYILILGVAQDAGYPQIGCYEEHCKRAWENPELRRSPTSFALIDPESKKKWLFEATPDIKDQLYLLEKYAPDSVYQLAGVFLTHGHMGHYTGLMQFGREAMGSQGIPVFAMPRMREFLSTNGPWSQLVNLRNIELQELNDSTTVSLTPSISIMPFKVPHRDEYTETVGYEISQEESSLVFIPDIDKWNKWDVDIRKVVQGSSLALLDATFFDGNELPGRNMAEIPHPFVEESVSLFSSLSKDQRSKIHFIHFNHTNLLLIEGSEMSLQLEKEGYNIAREGNFLLF